MDKNELSIVISRDCGVPTEDVKKVLDAFIKVVPDQLKRGQTIFIRGFGTFLMKERAEKKARNIAKGTTIIIPAHKTPHLRWSDSLK